MTGLHRRTVRPTCWSLRALLGALAGASVYSFVRGVAEYPGRATARFLQETAEQTVREYFAN
jgi:hypothetical protein